MWIDSHCHVSDERLLPHIPQLLTNMHTHKVNTALVIGTTLSDSKKVLEIVDNYSPLYASVGVHPEYKDSDEPTVEILLNLATQSSKVLAIGETGLDYHWFKTEYATNFHDLAWQRQRFCTHIHAAIICKKPMIVHTREAAKDTLELLTSEHAYQCGGIIHCFTENWEFAKAVLDLGFYISFSGIITFKNSHALREVVLKIPMDRILIETDSPYLAPVPKRGQDNQPAYVSYVGEFIAQLRNIDSIEFAQQTTENFWRLFKQ